MFDGNYHNWNFVSKVMQDLYHPQHRPIHQKRLARHSAKTTIRASSDP